MKIGRTDRPIALLSIFQSGTWSHRMSEWAILVDPAQPLQTENGRWIVFKRVRGTKRAEFVDGKTAVVPRCKVRFLTYPFQRTAISGNSFTYSQKFCGRHTLVFESQAQNRVHVETALIFITPAACHATDGRHLRRIVCRNMKSLQKNTYRTA